MEVPPGSPQGPPPHVTARQLGERLNVGGWTERREIVLACGLVMPTINVGAVAGYAREGSRLVLTIGLPPTGVVQLALEWRDGLAEAELKSFFHTHLLTAAYREALAERMAVLGRSIPAPHVFMLLVDELLYWATKRHGVTPECVLTLEDAARLDYAGTTPFALRGRTVLASVRTSRFLQFERGYGYYETFGWWPDDEQPEGYMQRVARFARHGGPIGAVPGDAGYDEMATRVEGHKTASFMNKTFPPVLPPGASGASEGADAAGTLPALRRFADMDDYYDRVIAVGRYGRVVAPGPGRPWHVWGNVARLAGAAGAAGEAADVEALVVAVRDNRDIRGPVVVDGVPAPSGVSTWRDGGVRNVRLGEWHVTVEPDEVCIIGPATHVREVARLAARLAAEFAPRAPTVWYFYSRERCETVYVNGSAFRAPDGRFLAPGTDQLTALGFEPGPPGAGAQWPGGPSALLAQARRADDELGGALVVPSHPRFEQLRRLGRALSHDRWVRRAERAPRQRAQPKRARGDQPEQPHDQPRDQPRHQPRDQPRDQPEQR
jgi:hypothetical protein